MAPLMLPLITSVMSDLVFVRDNNPIRSLEISIFSRFIGVDWSLIYEDHINH